MPFDTNFDASFDGPSQDETTELLIRARGLLERGWCQETTALDVDGVAVAAQSERAVRWCVVGALIAASIGDKITTGSTAYVRLRESVGMDIAVFNDAQETVDPVLAAFDRAIAAGGR